MARGLACELMSRAPGTPSTSLAVAALAAVSLGVFAIRLTGAPNLLDNEPRLGATVLNVLRDGNWLCPHDALGNTDKPPLLTWLSALASLPSGRVTRFTLYLPTALATLGVAVVVFAAGRRYFGRRAGFLGGLAYLLCDVGAKQMGTARWDGLFAFTVSLAALAAFDAWMTGGGWLAFWLAAAAATLTKGPLGVVLAALGLGAVAWERRSGTPKPLRGSQWAGVLVFLVLTLGWFLLAWRRVGWSLVDDMIGRELIGHAVEHAPGRRFFQPIGNLLVNFGPWSVCAVLACWRLVAAPDPDDETRRFERFLFCWGAGGLLLFSLSPHNDARLLWPIVPPAAILAGRELARLTGRVSTARLAGGCAAAVAVAGGAFVVQYHVLEPRRSEVQETRALEALARTIRADVGDGRHVEFVDAPYALELLLNVLRPAVTYSDAAALLDRDPAAVVAVMDIERLRRTLGARAADVDELAHGTVKGTPYVYVVRRRAARAAAAG